MKRKFIRWIACKNWFYRMAKKLIANRIVWGNNLLTPEHLLNLGWVEDNGEYHEFDIKDSARITIKFEHHYYRVWHGNPKTFIALKSSIEWFETYYLLIREDGYMYDLAGV